MKLKLRRNQKSSMMGGITFALSAQTELSEDEAEFVRKYKMGKEILYAREKVDTSGIGAPGSGAWSSLGRALAARALNITITANDLVQGKTIECKDIVEMRAAEEQIKEACAMFKQVLESAAHFEGEEVIEI